jgi:DNA repair protein RadC
MENVWNSTALSRIAEVELVYRNFIKPSDRPQVQESKIAYQHFLESWSENKIEFVEQFKIMLLSRACRILGILEISTGGVSGTVADVRLIYTAALKGNAAGLILAHNHPSGSLKPSDADIQLTRKICEAGKLLDIKIEDHLIITTEGYYSFADEGLL